MNEKVTIGNAELWHGDCLEILDDIESVDCVITDPPYGHNNNNGDLIHNWEAALGKIGKYTQSRAIANDGPEAETLFENVLPKLNKKLVPGGCCCCCCSGGGGPDPQFARWSLAMDAILDFKQMIVWDKGPMGMGWHYRRSYETILVAQKRGGKCKWYDKTNKVENIIRPGHGMNKIIPQHDDHPTPKPPRMAQHFASLHSQQNEIILDPFMGSGWVGVGVIPIGRKFIGIEIDRKWFDLACVKIDAIQRQTQLVL